MEHATRRYVSHNLNPGAIFEIICLSKKTRLGKTKWSATKKTKRGIVVVIFAEYPDFIKVITITKGGKSR